METPRAAGAQEKAVAVAVKKNRNSQLALKWAVENLMKESQSLTLVHVRPKESFRRGGQNDNLRYGELLAFCGPEVAKRLEQGYKDNMTMQAREIFNPLQSYCKKKNVHCDEVVLEDEDVIQALADFVLKNNIDVLVVGAGSRGGIMRKLKGPDSTNKISKNMPYFCTVYTVAKGGLISIKSSSCTAQTPASPHSLHVQEPEIGIQSFNTQIENRISVTVGASLLQPSPVNEFEFRSPLKYCEDSDFSWIGHCPSDTDISFIGSDRQLYDHVSPRLPTNNLGSDRQLYDHVSPRLPTSNLGSDRQLYDHVSPRLPTNNLNKGLGSFDAWNASSPAKRLGCGQGSFKCSGASGSPHKTKDESRRLQLELMHIKKVRAAACLEAFDTKMLALKKKPLNLEENQGNMVQDSPTTLAKLKSDREETA